MKLSIIVPCYNAESTIKKCVDSLLNCSYLNKEIILVDDGSSDNTKKIINNYAKKYDNVFSFSKENEGLGKTRNYGIEKSSGDYITFIDSDDYIDVEGYELMINLLEKDQSDVVYCGFRYVYEDKIRTDIFNCKNYYNNINEFLKYVFSTSKKYCGISACTGVYKTSIVKKIDSPFFSEKEFLSEDKLFNYRYLKCVESVSVIHNEFYNYVQHNNGGSITSSFKYYKFDAAYNMADYLLKNEKDISLEQYFAIDFLINLSGCFQMLFIDKKYNNDYRKNIIIEVLNNKKYFNIVKLINNRNLSFKFSVFRLFILSKCHIGIFLLFYINSRIK